MMIAVIVLVLAVEGLLVYNVMVVVVKLVEVLLMYNGDGGWGEVDIKKRLVR